MQGARVGELIRPARGALGEASSLIARNDAVSGVSVASVGKRRRVQVSSATWESSTRGGVGSCNVVAAKGRRQPVQRWLVT